MKKTSSEVFDSHVTIQRFQSCSGDNFENIKNDFSTLARIWVHGSASELSVICTYHIIFCLNYKLNIMSLAGLATVPI